MFWKYNTADLVLQYWTFCLHISVHLVVSGIMSPCVKVPMDLDFMVLFQLKILHHKQEPIDVPNQ